MRKLIQIGEILDEHVSIMEQTPEAFRYNWEAFKDVREQTPELCLEAIRQLAAFKYVKEQTPELCLEAIRYNWQL